MGITPEVIWTSAGVGVAAIGGSWGFWKWLTGRLDKKADKLAVNDSLQGFSSEIGILRGTQAKIFDQIRENEQRAQDRHERLMDRISERR